MFDYKHYYHVILIKTQNVIYIWVWMKWNQRSEQFWLILSLLSFFSVNLFQWCQWFYIFVCWMSECKRLLRFVSLIETSREKNLEKIDQNNISRCDKHWTAQYTFQFLVNNYPNWEGYWIIHFVRTHFAIWSSETKNYFRKCWNGRLKFDVKLKIEKMLGLRLIRKRVLNWFQWLICVTHTSVILFSALIWLLLLYQFAFVTCIDKKIEFSTKHDNQMDRLRWANGIK